MILQDRQSTSYDLVSLCPGSHNILNRWGRKIRRTDSQGSASEKRGQRMAQEHRISYREQEQDKEEASTLQEQEVRQQEEEEEEKEEASG